LFVFIHQEQVISTVDKLSTVCRQLNPICGDGGIRTLVQTSSKNAFYTLSFCWVFVCVFGQKPTETQLIFSDTTALQKPLNSRLDGFDISGETGRAKVFAETALT